MSAVRLLCRDGAVPFRSPSCVHRSVLLANWERVLCCGSAPEVSVSTHTHCSRTNENTPHHLPKRDTPSPSPCPSTLVPLSLFTLFVSFLFLHAPTSLSWPSHAHPSPFPTFSILPILTVLIHLCLFVPPPHFYHSVSSLLLYATCRSPPRLSQWEVCVCVCLFVLGWGGGVEAAVVLRCYCTPTPDFPNVRCDP